MLLMLISAGAGSTITLAIMMHYLYYLKTSGGFSGKDLKLKLGTIAMYGVAIVLSIIAVTVLKLSG